MSGQGHFRQIETLPALAACLLCPESGHSASIKLRWPTTRITLRQGIRVVR
jgi:hypothetical protein